MKILVVVSGGLDSVVLAHFESRYGDVEIVCFDYGQRARKEIDAAKACAEDLGAPFTLVDISSYGKLLKNNAITGSLIPSSEFGSPINYVPNRNVIFLAMACGLAEEKKADFVAIGVHAAEYPTLYKDCGPAFIELYAKMQFEVSKIPVVAPLLHLHKPAIVVVGSVLKVPFEKTWSCIHNEEFHCGVCSSCLARREAFVRANVTDPTIYLGTTAIPR